jgi:hypothetical protein
VDNQTKEKQSSPEKVQPGKRYTTVKLPTGIVLLLQTTNCIDVLSRELKKGPVPRNLQPDISIVTQQRYFFLDTNILIDALEKDNQEAKDLLDRMKNQGQLAITETVNGEYHGTHVVAKWKDIEIYEPILSMERKEKLYELFYRRYLESKKICKKTDALYPEYTTFCSNPEFNNERNDFYVSCDSQPFEILSLVIESPHFHKCIQLTWQIFLEANIWAASHKVEGCLVTVNHTLLKSIPEKELLCLFELEGVTKLIRLETVSFHKRKSCSDTTTTETVEKKAKQMDSK